tara:strand:- start:141 stop:257 length:117 start_codon:yes stop_codon:yes gene_type:complete
VTLEIIFGFVILSFMALFVWESSLIVENKNKKDKDNTL